MAEFLLQSDSDSLDIEYYILEELLKKNKYLHSYKTINKSKLDKLANKDNIPIGDIMFVTNWLKLVHNIEKENPIEIPEYLRTDEFLKRDYRIIKAKDLPRSGNYFIKDIDTLKSFTYSGNMICLNIDEMLKPRDKEFDTSLRIDGNSNYLVSSIFNIQSEYRVYVIGGKIEAISNYNGDVTVLPDINLIKKAVGIINKNEEWLKSYTIDVMVGPKGTAIIEVHNFASVGLYNTLWGDNLLYAYKHGIEYLVNDNKIRIK